MLPHSLLNKYQNSVNFDNTEALIVLFGIALLLEWVNIQNLKQ